MRKIIAVVISLLFLASCTTSNQVASNKLLQKRKYQKGWHVNNATKIDKSASSNQEEVAQNTVEIEEETESNRGESVESYGESDANQDAVTTSQIAETHDLREEQRGNEKGSFSETTSHNDITELVTEEASKTSIQDNNYQQKAKIAIESAAASDSDLLFILLIILCFVLPPLVVFIQRDIGTEFYISLILFLLAITAFGIFGGIGFLAGIVGVIYALLILFDAI